MEGSSWAIVAVAFVTGVFGLMQTLLNRRALSRIEQSGERIEERTTKIDDKADTVAEQVRTSGGRTVAQMTEDNSQELAQLRGDLMELAIQFAKHTGDHHTHNLILRQRQEQRDRKQLGHDMREVSRPPLAREPKHYWDDGSEFDEE